MSSSLAALPFALDAARPHALACGLALARIAPATFLCPVLGGQLAPSPVRLALGLGLALHVHFAGVVTVDWAASAGAPAVFAAFAQELACGLVIGLVAALPFDAARIGGRLLDTFRGANAEAALPAAGSREAATGDLLHQLLCALVCASALFPMLVRALLLSFRVAPLGAAASAPFAGGSELGTWLVVRQASAALGAGLAIGAPAAAVALVIDLAMGFAARTAPSLPVREIAAPVKLLAGAAAALLAVGVIAQRLLAEVAGGIGALQQAAGTTFGGSAP